LLVVKPLPGVMGLLDAPFGTPDGAVALEAAAKAELPEPVPFADPFQGLNVAQHVPGGRQRGSSMARNSHITVISSIIIIH
jgi:hypothetical protein